VTFSGDIPDRLAEATRFFRPFAEFPRIHCRHLSPALEILAIDNTFRTEIENVLDLRLIRDDANGVGAGRRHELDSEYAETAGGSPHQNVVAGLERVRRMPEQHPICGRKRECVAGRFFPRQVARLRHQLARLHAAELRKRSVRGLVTPDALRRREQGVATVAVLVIAIILIAMDNDLVADLPAFDLRADS